MLCKCWFYIPSSSRIEESEQSEIVVSSTKSLYHIVKPATISILWGLLSWIVILWVFSSRCTCFLLTQTSLPCSSDIHSRDKTVCKLWFCDARLVKKHCSMKGKVSHKRIVFFPIGNTVTVSFTPWLHFCCFLNLPYFLAFQPRQLIPLSVSSPQLIIEAGAYMRQAFKRGGVV